MRKLIVSNMITLDGVYAGRNGELDWHITDAEFDAFAAEQLSTMGTILFGRVTYEMMCSYWPTPPAIADDPAVAGYMNSLPKVVVSNTLAAAPWGEWESATLLRGDLTAGISALKQQPGKDIVIFGSGQVVAGLVASGLIDEYRLFVAPLIYGAGQALFPAVAERIPLRLLDTRTFDSGLVLLRYAHADASHHDRDQIEAQRR